jgi:hypothetical protein
MALGVMIFMRANPLQGPATFLGAKGNSLRQLPGPKKVSIFRAHLFNGLSNEFVSIKIKAQALYKKHLHW